MLAAFLATGQAAFGKGVGSLFCADADRAPAEKSPDPFFEGRLCPLEERLFADAADGRLDEFSLLEAALIASGVEDVDALRCYSKQQDALVDELQRSEKLTGAPCLRAQVVLEFMHRRVLYAGYQIDGTDLRKALDEGRFNCVSATVLFNCLAGEVGLNVCGLEIPSHAMSRVFLQDGSLDVETTCPAWFRLMEDPKRQAELVETTIGRHRAKDRSPAREISAVQMVAMIYYNRGVDLLAEKRFERAAVANAKAWRLDPASTTARGNLLATINNWAIALGAAGDCAQGVERLSQGLAFDPQYEPFVLNYVHLHHQWAEQLCGAGKFEEALTVLDRAAAEMPDQPYLQRAPLDVYRRWAAALFGQGEPERAFAVFARARSRLGASPELRDAEVAAVNDHALALLEQGKFAEAVVLFDRGLAEQPDAQLLRDNRRIAAIRSQAANQGDLPRESHHVGPMQPSLQEVRHQQVGVQAAGVLAEETLLHRGLGTLGHADDHAP